MKSLVHTPGPWVDDPHDINGNLNPINTRDEGWTKIRGSNGELVVGDIDISTPEGEANLRLILATHDLLDALRELADLVDDMRSGNYSPDSFTTQPARLAIAKAAGKVV